MRQFSRPQPAYREFDLNGISFVLILFDSKINIYLFCSCAVSDIRVNFFSRELSPTEIFFMYIIFKPGCAFQIPYLFSPSEQKKLLLFLMPFSNICNV